MAVTRTLTPDHDSTVAATHVHSFSGTPTSGRLLVVGIGADTPHTGISSVDSKFTKAVGVSRGGTGFSASIWYRVVQPGDTASFSWTLPASLNAQSAGAEWSGLLATNPLDTTASADGGGTNVITLSVGPTAVLERPEELAVAFMFKNGFGGGSDVPGTPGGGFTAQDQFQKEQLISRTTSAVTALTPVFNWSSAAQAVGVVATFKGTTTPTSGGSGIPARWWDATEWDRAGVMKHRTGSSTWV